MMSLDVIGGVYNEYVLKPHHIALLGSAGRGACSIGPDRAKIVLHTALGDDQALNLASLASAFGFTANRTRSERSLSFSYVHGLDSPLITPEPHTIRSKPKLALEAERVLCYGALDFDWAVSAEQAVYDPQDAFGARTFGSRGSTANRLAIVLNEYEASYITGEMAPEDMVTALFEKENAEAVILKRGVTGTIVATKDGERNTIPPYLTRNVFKLGSGDVFSAIFAWAWMIDGQTALESAHLAGISTAYYVETHAQVIPLDVRAQGESLGIRPAVGHAKANQTVYLAGPFFTLTQLWLVEEARMHLQSAGLIVFSPYHDVGHGTAEVVAPRDLDAIDRCDIVYAIVGGFDPGTMFEIGYARAKNKPVVVFVENEKDEDLKMLKGTDCVLLDDFASSIYRAAWAALYPQ